MKRYVALFAPDFRLQATLRHSPHLKEAPVALLDTLGKKMVIAELNSNARKARVDVGMTATQAVARCADLHLLAANPGHERAAQETLLQVAESVSPFLEITEPGIITIDYPPEKHVDEESLRRKLHEPLRLVELDVRVGMAETPFLASLAARLAEPVRIVDESDVFLAPLPISTLSPNEEILGVLHAWGIHTIGKLVSLPMTEVCERLGPEAAALWERARGGHERPLKLVKPQELFSEQTDLENPVEMLEPLLFILRRFLEQLSARLANAYLVAGKLRLVLRFENNSPYQRVFDIPQPTRDVDLLFRLLHTHLENFSSQSAIVGMELAAKPMRPQTEQYGLLEKGLKDPHQFAETVGRLQALLGSKRVGAPELESSHHPDAYRMTAFDPQASAPVSEDPIVGIPWMRFRPPIPAKVVLNENRLAYIYSARCTGTIRESCGPWQMQGAWWQPEQWSREEWDVETDDGVYRLVRNKEGWFLDGIYG